MASERQRRATLRKRDLNVAYEFAESHGLKICGLRTHADGGFSLDFGDRPANDDEIDRELAALESRHGEG